MKNRYLRVDFYDNDFGHLVCFALERLWKFIHENNSHCLIGGDHFSDRTITDIFTELNNADSLVSMINRLFESESIASDVESVTRGFYWKKVDWTEAKITNEIQGNTYLSFGVSFHDNNEFSKEWNNSESSYLDLETGKAESF